MSILHSIVVPVFNEEAGIEKLHSRLASVISKLSDEFEVIFVNDGSRDRSGELLNQVSEKDSRFKVLHFSRNFGHQVAITAGIEWASGQTVSVIDADLQDPPEVILEMISKWREGYEVVFGVRNHREGETFFKLLTAKIFYRMIRRLTQVDIPVDTGDFRLMDRKAVDAFLMLPERHRFVRGLVSWVGFRQTGVKYDRASREFGETHYPLKKMLKFAIDGVTSFSTLPLQMASYLGFIAAFIAVLGIFYSLYLKSTGQTIQGWTSLILVVLFLGGAQLLALGVIGEYLGRTFDETRKRPLYLLGSIKGFSPTSMQRKPRFTNSMVSEV